MLPGFRERGRAEELRAAWAAWLVKDAVFEDARKVLVDDALKRQIQAEQREYARLGWLGRWRWRRERFGPPIGWRAMSLGARRRLRRGG